MEYVNAVPAERVAQIHIAGHSRYEKYILDTHDHPVIDPVWNSTPVQSSAAAKRPRSSSGTTTSPPSMKSTPKRKKQNVTCINRMPQSLP